MEKENTEMEVRLRIVEALISDGFTPRSNPHFYEGIEKVWEFVRGKGEAPTIRVTIDKQTVEAAFAKTLVETPEPKMHIVSEIAALHKRAREEGKTSVKMSFFEWVDWVYKKPEPAKRALRLVVDGKEIPFASLKICRADMPDWPEYRANNWIESPAPNEEAQPSNNLAFEQVRAALHNYYDRPEPRNPKGFVFTDNCFVYEITRTEIAQYEREIEKEIEPSGEIGKGKATDIEIAEIKFLESVELLIDCLPENEPQRSIAGSRLRDLSDQYLQHFEDAMSGSFLHIWSSVPIKPADQLRPPTRPTTPEKATDPERQALCAMVGACDEYFRVTGKDKFYTAEGGRELKIVTQKIESQEKHGGEDLSQYSK